MHKKNENLRLFDFFNDFFFAIRIWILLVCCKLRNHMYKHCITQVYSSVGSERIEDGEESDDSLFEISKSGLGLDSEKSKSGL